MKVKVIFIASIALISIMSSCNFSNNVNNEKMIEKEKFEEMINNGKPSIIDFYADWCAPCKIQAPIIDELKQELAGKVNVIKVDVDSNSEIAQDFNVVSIPTIVILQDGKKVWKEVGVQSKEILLDAVNKLM